MTRKSKRELSRDVAALTESSGTDGFHVVKIGGDPDPRECGFHTWDPAVGAYINKHGHRIAPEDAPDSEFEYTVCYPGEQ
jgi:hypothetical protein